MNDRDTEGREAEQPPPARSPLKDPAGKPRTRKALGIMVILIIVIAAVIFVGFNSFYVARSS